VPAHNEQTLIRATLASILPQLGARDRVIVVADNCTDRTADLARCAGAIVIERTDPMHRGKGYALACGVEALRASPPDVVIVCDADLEMPANAIATLASQVMQSKTCAQAVYVLSADDCGAGFSFGATQGGRQPAISTTRSHVAPFVRESDPPRHSAENRISSLAFIVKNVVRPMGLDRLGCSVPLTGTGMAFPWPAIAAAPLAGGDLVEDMRLGVWMLAAGFGPKLCPAVTIRGALPTNQRDALQQRRRWEHGHLKLILSASVPLLLAGIRRGKTTLIVAALDTLVPPLSLLLFLWSVIACVSLLPALKAGMWGPLAVNATAGMMLASAILLAWRAHGRELSLSALLAVPLYVAWKIPMYVQFLFKRQTEWIRTART
jgi:cellulose synthase/poly-beta-1,6-N-acetylglucosamine synthase-like glycosyltransferase